MDYIESIVPSQGGINYDDDERVMSNSDGRVRENLMIDTDGYYGNLLGISGTASCSFVVPSGRSTVCIGRCRDYDNDAVIFFMANSYGNDMIVRVVDADTSELLLLEDMGWLTSDRVQASFMDGKLYWAVQGEAYKANTERLRLMTLLRDESVERYDGTSSVTVAAGDWVYVLGSGMYKNMTSGAITMTDGLDPSLTFIADMYWDVSTYPEQIKLIKQPPLATVLVEGKTSPDVTENLLEEGAMRFTYCYIFHDDEKSVYAAPSRLLVISDKEESQQNAVDVTLSMGNEDVKTVRLLVQDVMTNTWYRVTDISAKDFEGRQTYTYEYTGTSRQEVVPSDDVDRLYDSVPVGVNALTSINNTVVLSNLTDGYDASPAAMTVEVVEGGSLSLATGERTTHEFSGVTKTFRTRFIRFVGIGGTDVVPYGTRYRLVVVEGGDVKPIGSVEADGVKTGNEFREEMMALYNDIRNHVAEALSYAVASELNVWATFRYVLSGQVGFFLIYGVRGQVLEGTSITLDYLEGESFNGEVEAGEYVVGTDDLYDAMDSAYPPNVESPWFYHFANVGIMPLSVTYKTYGTYEVSLRYYDEFKRSMPAVSSKRVEIDGTYGNPKSLKVTLTSAPPSWAKYFSITNTACNITDSAAMRVIGGGRIDYVAGDPSGWFREISITGLKASDVPDSNIIYWYIGKVYTDIDRPFELDPSNYLIFSTGTDSSDYPSFKVLAAFRLRGIQTVLYNDEPCWRVDAYSGQYKYADDPEWRTVDTDGYAIISKDIAEVGTSATRYAIPTFNKTIETDDGYELTFDIANYVNMVRTYMSPDKNVYLPGKGDYVRVMAHGYVTLGKSRVKSIEERRVVEAEEGSFFSSYLVTLESMENNVTLENGGFVEFYRMSTQEANLLHEEPVLRPISAHSEVMVTNGDCYSRSRQDVAVNGEVKGTSYRVEEFRFSDVVNSKMWQMGRVQTVEANVKQKHIPTAMRHGGRLLEGTRINDTCRFDGEDVTYLDSVDGDIQIAVPLGEQMLRVLQTGRGVTVDVGVSQRVSPDGTQEFVVSDRFFGSKRKSRNRWGTQNPEGVLEYDGNMYYFDAQTSQMIKDGQHGQHPISGKVMMGEWSHDYKMHTYFNEWGAAWTASTRVMLGADVKNDTIYATISSSLAEPNTVGFSVSRNRWFSSFPTMRPTMYENVGQKLFSVSGSNIWMHNQGERRKIYGEKSPVRLGMVFNSQPSLMKLLDSLALKMTEVDVDSLPDDFVEINIHPSASYPEGMKTYVTKEMMRLEENAYRSYIMRNVLTPDMEEEDVPFFDGEDMRGYSGSILIDFGDSDVVFTLCELGMTVSK